MQFGNTISKFDSESFSQQFVTSCKEFIDNADSELPIPISYKTIMKAAIHATSGIKYSRN